MEKRLKLRFKEYYKYTFYFDVLDGRKKIGEFHYGGDANDIYKLEVKRDMWLDDFLFEEDIEAFLNGKEFDLWSDGFTLKRV